MPLPREIYMLDTQHLLQLLNVEGLSEETREGIEEELNLRAIDSSDPRFWDVTDDERNR